MKNPKMDKMVRFSKNQ